MMPCQFPTSCTACLFTSPPRQKLLRLSSKKPRYRRLSSPHPLLQLSCTTQLRGSFQKSHGSVFFVPMHHRTIKDQFYTTLNYELENAVLPNINDGKYNGQWSSFQPDCIASFPSPMQWQCQKNWMNKKFEIIGDWVQEQAMKVAGGNKNTLVSMELLDDGAAGRLGAE